MSSSSDPSSFVVNPPAGASSDIPAQLPPESSTAPSFAPALLEDALVLPTLKRHKKPDVLLEISRSLPVGVELYRTWRFRLDGDVVILGINVPGSLESKLRDWREGLKQKYPQTAVFFRRITAEENLQNNLRSTFRGVSLMTEDSSQLLSEMIVNLCGKQPKSPLEPRTTKPKREDLRNVPFIAIDEPGVLNREDLVYGERKQDGTLVLKVAIIDITDFIRPFSERYFYAMRVGSDYFGRRTTISTISTELAHGLGSFKLGETRPAWVLELRILPNQGVEDASFKFKRAEVVNHWNLNPTEPFDVKMHPMIAPTISALADITRILERNRISHSPIIAIDGQGTTSRILAETMIASYERLSEHLSKILGSSAAYVVHNKLSDADLRGWVEPLQQLKIPFQPKEESYPKGIREILSQLEQLNSPLARSMENTIIDQALLRSRFSTSNRGHLGLRVDGYTRFKPRDAVGLLNQLNTDAAMGSSELISPEEVEYRVKLLNDRRWKREEKHYQLRFLEMLQEKLELVGRSFLAEVAQGREASSDYVYLDVQGFSKWGFMLRAPELSLKAQDPIVVTLKGFHLSRMRFEFEPTTQALPPAL